MLSYSIKVVLPKKERNEYITHIHLYNLSEKIDIDKVKDMALSEVKRRPWLKLSDIEKNKIVAIEVKYI